MMLASGVDASYGGDGPLSGGHEFLWLFVEGLFTSCAAEINAGSVVLGFVLGQRDIDHHAADRILGLLVEHRQRCPGRLRLCFCA